MLKVQWYRSKTAAIGAGIVLVLVALFATFQLRGREVLAVKAKRGLVVQRIVATGRVEPFARIAVGAQVAARVADVQVSEGESVAVGQILFSLDDDEPKAAVEQNLAAYNQALSRIDQLHDVGARVAIENVKQAEMRFNAAREDVRQEEQLHAAQATTPEALEHARTQLKVARSQLDAARLEAHGSSNQGSESKLARAAADQARANLTAAEARLSWYQLKAPLAGTVLKRTVERGDSVRPGEPVIVLAAAGPLMLSVQVDEKHLSLLKTGQQARAVADAYPDQYFDAQLSTIAPAVDADRGAIEIKLTTVKPPTFLKFDMSVSVEITTNRLENVVYLPADAIQEASSAHPFVYVSESGKASRREVKLGARGDDIFEITAGVDEGDVVLVQRDNLISQGQRVRAKLKEQ